MAKSSGALLENVPLPAADLAGLGFAHAAFISRFADNARHTAPASPGPDFEQVIEPSCNAVLSAHFALQPDPQYIRHTGGSTAQPDALACLLRLKASF